MPTVAGLLLGVLVVRVPLLVVTSFVAPAKSSVLVELTLWFALLLLPPGFIPPERWLRQAGHGPVALPVVLALLPLVDLLLLDDH